MNTDNTPLQIKARNEKKVGLDSSIEFEEELDSIMDYSIKTNAKLCEVLTENRCRICFNCDDTVDNPIILPCKCKDNLGYIHVNCLRKWIDQDLTCSEVSQFQINYVYSKLNCEVCRGVYPDVLKLKGKRYHLYNFPRPSDSEYIVF